MRLPLALLLIAPLLAGCLERGQPVMQDTSVDDDAYCRANSGKPGSDDTTGLAARFSNPHGIWGDGIDLFVADSANFAIRRLSPLRTGAEPNVISIPPSRLARLRSGA